MVSDLAYYSWLWLPLVLLPITFLLIFVISRLMNAVIANFFFVAFEKDKKAAAFCFLLLFLLIGVVWLFSQVYDWIFAMGSPTIGGLPSWAYIMLFFVAFFALGWFINKFKAKNSVSNNKV